MGSYIRIFSNPNKDFLEHGLKEIEINKELYKRLLKDKIPLYALIPTSSKALVEFFNAYQKIEIVYKNKKKLLISGTYKELTEIANSVAITFPEISKALKNSLNNIEKKDFRLKLKDRIWRIGGKTLIMGVINVTPDSFSDGGKFYEKEKAISHGFKLLEEGADIIDIGGESARPGSHPISYEEEIRRVIPVIEALADKTDIPISIDTYKPKVALAAIKAGATIINDISGLTFEPSLADVAAKYNTPLILMHTKGRPDVMQKDLHYDSLIGDIIDYLSNSIDRATAKGVDPQQIIIDPGIGFGKSVEQNLELIKYLSEFKVLGKPILIGTSRKSFIGKILDLDVDQREEGTLTTISASILNGANIVRVHNVKIAQRAVKMIDAIKGV